MNVTIRPTGSDDTQLLRDAIASAEPYSTLTLDGQFSVAGNVAVRSDNITILGYGACVRQQLQHAKTFELTRCGNVRLFGLSIIGIGTEKPWVQPVNQYNGVAAVYVASSHGVDVKDCHITRHAGGSLVLDGECSAVRMHHNTIAGMGSEFIAAGDNGCDAAIAGTANSIAKSGISIAHNDISGHAFGLLMPGDIGCLVTTNHIHHIPGQHAMYMARGGDCVVSSNLIDHCAMIGIKFQHQTPEHIDPALTITGNTVTDCGSIAIGVLTTGAGIGWGITNVSVTANNVAKCDYPLYFRGLRGAMVASNRARKCKHAMVKVSSDGTFADNLFIECGT